MPVRHFLRSDYLHIFFSIKFLLFVYTKSTKLVVIIIRNIHVRLQAHRFFVHFCNMGSRVCYMYDRKEYHLE